MRDEFDAIIGGLRRLRQDIEEGIQEGARAHMTTVEILSRLRALQAQAVELRRPPEEVVSLPAAQALN
jgi:hypothetical protein